MALFTENLPQYLPVSIVYFLLVTKTAGFNWMVDKSYLLSVEADYCTLRSAKLMHSGIHNLLWIHEMVLTNLIFMEFLLL